jgi:ACS family pantothenate transporter-like MFS transporter
MSLLTQIRVVVWGKPAETKAERRLIVKIDFFILSYVCLMYWVNYLDRSNLNNAYVSGMREDLKFQGNQLNIINTGMCSASVAHFGWRLLTLLASVL